MQNAISAVKTVRAQDQSRKESAFQQAVADGLDYAGQVAYRERQLAEEESSGFADPEYRSQLQESLATTKRLKRFYDYREKYREALGELNSGHSNAIEYAKTLRRLFDDATDPDLKAEIQTNLNEAETRVTTYKNTVLNNQVKLAQFDGTEKTINSVLKKVKQARSLAEINGNDDEVEAYNLTIAALNSQKVQAKAEDVVNDIAVSGMLGANNASSKLKTIALQIAEADTETPVTINGKRFDSEQQYWEITRNAYLSGNGSGVFADYFSDLETQYKEKIDGETARFGFVQPSTIQKINSELTILRTQPEMAPFIDRIDSFRATAVASAVSTVAKTVIDRATYTGDFTQADTTLKGLGTTYGVDTTGYQLQLGTILNQQVNASIEAGQGVPAEAALLPASDFAVPSVSTEMTPAPTPQGATQTTTGTMPPPTTATRSDYNVVSGDTLSGIAARNGMSLTQLLELNPEYKANPNAVSVGATLKLAAPAPATPAPVVAPVASPVSPTPMPSDAQRKAESARLKQFSIDNPAKPTETTSMTPSERLKQFSIENSPKGSVKPTRQQIRQVNKLKAQVEELQRRADLQSGKIKTQ